MVNEFGFLEFSFLYLDAIVDDSDTFLGERILLCAFFFVLLSVFNIQWAILILGVFITYNGHFFLYSVDNLYRGFSFVFIGRFYMQWAIIILGVFIIDSGQLLYWAFLYSDVVYSGHFVSIIAANFAEDNALPIL